MTSRQPRPLRIFLSAGESSGDLLGGRLMAALKRLHGGPIEFRGVGGPEMERQGLTSLFPISDLAVMGLVEVLPHIPKLKRRIREAAQAAVGFEPDVMVTIDAPGFNKRLAKACGSTPFAKVHYVAPTVWAWRPKRVFAFRDLFDRLLCLLPFEPPYFEKVGLTAPFVGHSVLESPAATVTGDGFRARHGIADTVRLFCVLPGSRRGEIERLLPVFRDTIARISSQPGGKVVCVVPTVPHLRETVEAELAAWPVTAMPIADQGEKYEAMAASDAALAASGTVALELALTGTPTVIAYRISPISYQILSRIVKARFAHILNILADRAVVPEFIQNDCTVEKLAPVLNHMTGPVGKDQIAALRPYLAQLSPEDGGSPSEAAARAVLDALK
ncbi:lipid-A-disaccharide synthase [Rhodospirillaceae bacterium KN72]|uniref:Lipid-A-disaccharide synthase n=1 Tax=Pacificispira spongiicola TaxID=2729598 RepID=A0A7Y0DYN2_9PROT|nr:lipid-A-disaccharide synthase [Pacificispira spongiicola]NMM44024.1 lipid-A-disaccharide synthase [Pacificispira spongiicola]